MALITSNLSASSIIGTDSVPGIRSLLSGAGGSGPFTPATLSGLILWLDAQNVASITMDGSNRVSQWNDLSSSNAPATAAVLANQPVYAAAQINAFPAMTFNGINQYFDVPLFPTILECSVFVVVNSITSATSRVVFGKRSNSNGVPVSALIQITTTGTNTFTARDNLGAIGTATAAGSVTGPYCISGIKQIVGGVTMNLSVFRNNANTGVANGIAYSTTTGDNNTTVGAQYGGSPVPNSYTNSPIGEVVVYNRALTTPEQAQVYAYLQVKWGL